MSQYTRVSGQITYKSDDALERCVEYLRNEWSPIETTADLDPKDAVARDDVIACTDANTLVIPDRTYRNLQRWVPGLTTAATDGTLTLTTTDGHLNATIVRPDLWIDVDLVEWGHIALEGPIMDGNEISQHVFDAFHERFNSAAGLPPSTVIDSCASPPLFS